MRKSVLVTPLDWGLGHAARSVPIIKELRARGHEVLVGSAGQALALLQKEFADLKTLTLPSYDPRYDSNNMALNILRQTRKFLKAVKAEHEFVEEIVEKYQINTIISDNRYGCWSESAPSIFISHQLSIQTPGIFNLTKSSINAINRRMISKFREYWIPDFPDHRLSGDLSRNNKLENVRFIGSLSRFDPTETVNETKYYLLVLLSGPEPQRTRLEKILVAQLEEIQELCCIVRGVTREHSEEIQSRHDVVDLVAGEGLQKLFTESSIIVSRPGYSTIMDLTRFTKKAIFIPTPGQTEQEYLGEKFDKEKIALCHRQNSIRLKEAIRQLVEYSGFSKNDSGSILLENALKKNEL